jgi:hypothetical protein
MGLLEFIWSIFEGPAEVMRVASRGVMPENA